MNELEQIEKEFDNLISSYDNFNVLGTIDLNNLLYGYLTQTNTFNNGITYYLNNLNKFYKNLPNQNVDLDTFDNINKKYDELKEKIVNKQKEVKKLLDLKEKELENINSKISEFNKKIKQIDEEIAKMQPNNLNLSIKKDERIDLLNNLDKEYNRKMVNEFGESIKNNQIYKDRISRINKRINQKSKKNIHPSPQIIQTPVPETSDSLNSSSKKTSEVQKTTIVKNSIQDYMNRGILPKIPMSEFSKILDDLSIKYLNTKDIFSMVLTDEQLKRIVTNRKVNMYKVKNEIMDSHDEVIDNYDNLINNYNDMQEMLKQRKAFTDSEHMDEVIDSLDNEKKQHKQKISAIDVNDIESYNLNGKVNKKLDRIDKKVVINDENLNSQYHLLQNYKNQLENKSYSTNKKKVEKNIKKTEERIKTLQAKQGKLNEKQSMIINKNNKEYIKHVKARQQTYVKNQAVTSVIVQNINDNIYDINDYSKQVALNNSSINKLNGNSLSEKARRGILRGNNRALQARINAAKKMRGISSSMLEQQLRVSTNQIKGQVAHSM